MHQVILDKPIYIGLTVLESSKRIMIDKPIYIGLTVLESSKRIMMDLHCNTIKKTEDLGADMMEMGVFDFSNYPESHP